MSRGAPKRRRTTNATSHNVPRTARLNELLREIIADVRAFCGEATQSDDVTVVMVRYDGDPGPANP